ncbi:hypothetical protein [Sporosalibacterium faouarense]|uniref:hypothetical protein n=1 Tax=Sporosalibacterium faouarense TaxID=516123 RepID=UPI00141D018B|nr:hypothetical protein [Sporosalibacterium faouarense]MTI49157.1 hypothetical protein [Bacillota bacterium]
MNEYPTPGQEKLISNYCDSIINQIETIVHDYDKYVDSDGDLKFNSRYQEISDNREVQDLISLLKHVKEDFITSAKNLEEGTNAFKTYLQNENFESRYDRLREYFVLPEFDQFLQDIDKE